MIKLNDSILEGIAENIKNYCQKHLSIIDEFCYDIKALSDSWSGDGYESLETKVERITRSTESCICSISQNYPKYFYENAELIRSRPTFSRGNAGFARTTSQSSNSADKNGGSIFDQVFAKCNKDVTSRILFYLRRNRMLTPKDSGVCFYDPLGISKQRMYKDIMMIDINSPTFHNDLLSLTGQQLFFQVVHEQRMLLLRSLGLEINNQSLKDDAGYQELTQKILEGKGINTTYLSFPDDATRHSFNFYTYAFQATIGKDNNRIADYKRYYSKTYQVFLTILHGLINY